MTAITHIFFDLHGTLVDGHRLHPCYTYHLAQTLSERYGGAPEAWIDANRQILSDWDAYYADLDLNGEHGIRDMWEGLYRTTRAMFRLVRIPEPEREALQQLARELPWHATRNCDAFYPDGRETVHHLDAAGFILGVTSHAITPHSRGALHGAGVLDCFSGPIIGPDLIDHFEKDETFYQRAAHHAGVAPEHCLTVDDSPHAVRGARRAGMTALLITRRGTAQTDADNVLTNGLPDLISYVQAIDRSPGHNP